MELKVGMSFRVFRVDNDIYSKNRNGKVFAEKLSWFYGDEFGVDLCVGDTPSDYFGIDDRKHATCVGKLTITKLRTGLQIDLNDF